MPPLLVFLKFIFTAMEKDTGTKIGDFLKNFMGNVLIYISMCQLAGCCYDYKVIIT